MRFLLFFAVIFASCKTIQPSQSLTVQTYTALGVGCFDGDSPTIRLTEPDTTYHVRLYGIDAPERPSLYVTKRQPGSQEASDTLRRLLRGKTLTVLPVYTDMFDREVSRIFVDSTDVSVFMIQNGLAWYRAEPKMASAEKSAFKTLQNNAKKRKVGLWGLNGIKYNPATWRREYSGWKQR